MPRCRPVLKFAAQADLGRLAFKNPLARLTHRLTLGAIVMRMGFKDFNRVASLAGPRQT
jgi:hypothetical protein